MIALVRISPSVFTARGTTNSPWERQGSRATKIRRATKPNRVSDCLPSSRALPLPTSRARVPSASPNAWDPGAFLFADHDVARLEHATLHDNGHNLDMEPNIDRQVRRRCVGHGGHSALRLSVKPLAIAGLRLADETWPLVEPKSSWRSRAA